MVQMTRLTQWSILTQMSGGGDYLTISGIVYDHPSIQDGEKVSPGTFVSFNRQTMIGRSLSGRIWSLEDFVANGNAPTLEDALNFIENNWVKAPKVNLPGNPGGGGCPACGMG